MTFIFSKYKKNTTLSIAMLVLIQGALTGCGSDFANMDPWSFMTSKKSTAKNFETVPPPPVIADPLAQTSTYSPKLGGNLGSLGFNLETYMVEDVQDPMDRIKRLERAILALHKDLKVMGPAVQNLSKLEREIRSIKKDMAVPRSLVPIQGHAAAAAPQGLIKSGSVASTPVNRGSKKLAKSVDGKAVISGVRIGDHADKVRLVFDVSQKISYGVDIDNGENIMVVDLPNSVWQGKMQEKFGPRSALKSYKVEKSGDGHIMVVNLRGSSSVLKKMVLDSLSGNGKRIVIDLSK